MAKGDMGVIQRAVRKRGYRFERSDSGRGHERLIGPDGEVVTDIETGLPITIAGTPGDWRTRTKMVSQLRRNGVLEHDPFGQRPTDKTLNSERERTPLEPIAESPAVELRRETHRRLVDEIKVFVAKTGGTTLIRQTAWAGKHWMDGQDHVEGPISARYAEQQLESLLAGKTLPLREEQAWQALLDEVNGDSDPSLRWIEMVREARGIGWL